MARDQLQPLISLYGIYIYNIISVECCLDHDTYQEALTFDIVIMTFLIFKILTFAEDFFNENSKLGKYDYMTGSEIFVMQSSLFSKTYKMHFQPTPTLTLISFKYVTAIYEIRRSKSKNKIS